ncbi:hypothetical protein LX36DRAFT_661362 [Colletotrichum falcatum]|nr:hypothetical protein LX36DRAFT_661362 [Colletotrichum falcatum]
MHPRASQLASTRRTTIQVGRISPFATQSAPSRQRVEQHTPLDGSRNMAVRYVRPQHATRTFGRASARAARAVSTPPSTTKTRTRSARSNRAEPRLGNKKASKAEAVTKSPKRAGMPKSQDYVESDELVGWKYYPSSKTVDIVTLRPADDSQRLVPERIVQQTCPLRLYAYWASFSQPREQTIGTNEYHVFDIIGSRLPNEVKVQWVGYPSSDGDTTWEPASKVRKMAPKLLRDYVSRKEAAKEHTRTRKPVGVSQSGTAEGAQG